MSLRSKCSLTQVCLTFSSFRNRHGHICWQPNKNCFWYVLQTGIDPHACKAGLNNLNIIQWQFSKIYFRWQKPQKRHPDELSASVNQTDKGCTGICKARRLFYPRNTNMEIIHFQTSCFRWCGSTMVAFLTVAVSVMAASDKTCFSIACRRAMSEYIGEHYSRSLLADMLPICQTIHLRITASRIYIRLLLQSNIYILNRKLSHPGTVEWRVRSMLFRDDSWQGKPDSVHLLKKLVLKVDITTRNYFLAFPAGP